jgi:hypothetical protein
MVDIAGVEFGMVQAIPDCAFRELMRVIEFGLLAVLDAIESLLLGRGDELVVDEQRSGGLVIHRVDSKDVQLPPPCLTLQLRKLASIVVFGPQLPQIGRGLSPDWPASARNPCSRSG